MLGVLVLAFAIRSVLFSPQSAHFCHTHHHALCPRGYQSLAETEAMLRHKLDSIVANNITHGRVTRNESTVGFLKFIRRCFFIHMRKYVSVCEAGTRIDEERRVCWRRTPTPADMEQDVVFSAESFIVTETRPDHLVEYLCQTPWRSRLFFRYLCLLVAAALLLSSMKDFGLPQTRTTGLGWMISSQSLCR